MFELGVGHLGDLARDHQVGVFAADADRLAALPVDGRDDVLVDEAREDHLDHLDGGLVGNTQALHEVGLDLQLLEHRSDLRSAAVDDDRVNPRLLEVDDVLREGVGEGLVAHGVAAELDHNRLLVVADEVRQRLGQDARLDKRGRIGLGNRRGALRRHDRLHIPGLGFCVPRQ